MKISIVTDSIAGLLGEVMRRHTIGAVLPYIHPDFEQFQAGIYFK